MKQLKRKLMMTLALLITAATGAWAQDAYEQFTTADRNRTQLEFTGEHFKITGTKIDEYGMYVQSDCPVTISALNGETITKVEMTIHYLYEWEATHTIVSTPDATIDGAYSTGQTFTITPTGANASEITLSANVDIDNAQLQVIEWKVYYTNAASGTPVDLTRGMGDKINEWTLTNGMPAGNVTVSVEYFPQATAEGAVTAATGVKATTEDALVTIDETKLTGVAKMMYYVSTEATAPAYDAEGWTDKVPTAENYTQAANLNVWYYPVGTDEGVGEATATYSDGDMNATALAVSLGDAPTYDVTLNAEGLSTDEAAAWQAGKGTDDPDAFPLKGVKKGDKVTVTYTGTRKVIGVKAEKKAKATGPTTVTWDNDDITGTGKSFTKDGVTITAGSINFNDKNFEGGGTFTTTLGNFTKIEVTTEYWGASGTGWSGSLTGGTWTGTPASSVSFSGEIVGMGSGNTKFVFTIEPTN